MNFFNKWSASRLTVAALSILAVVVGAYSAYSAYLSRGLWQTCLNGGQCPIQSNPVYLQGLYAVVRAQLDMGIVLVAIGAFALICTILIFNPVPQETSKKEWPRLRTLSECVIHRSDLLALICLFTLLTILFTWPLAQNFTTFVNGSTEDVFHEIWYLILGSHLPYGPFFAFYTNSILYPTGVPLYFQVISPFNTTIFMLLSRLIGNVPAYNTLYMFTFVASATTMYIFVHYLTKNKYAAFIAAIIFAFSPIHLGEGVNHLNIMSSEFLPLFGYFLVRMGRENSWRNAFYAAVAIVLNAMCDLHFLFLSIFLLLCFLVYFAFVQRGIILNKEFILRLVVFGIASILLGILVYFQTFFGLIFAPLALSGNASTGLLTAVGKAADVLAFFVPSSKNPFFSSFSAPFYVHFLAKQNVRTYIGYTTLVLSILGFVVSKNKKQVWFWGVLGLFGFLMSVGPYFEVNGKVTNIPGIWQWFFYLFPFFKTIRSPYRFDYLTMLGLGVLAGYGVSSIMSAISNRGPTFHHKSKELIKVGVILLISLLLIVEFLPIPFQEFNVVPPSPYQQILAQDQSNYAVIEVPMIGDAHVFLYYAASVGYQVANGRISRNTAESLAFADSIPFINQLGSYLPGREPQPDILNQNVSWLVVAPYILAEYNIKYIILHRDFSSNVTYSKYYNLISSVLGLPYYQNNEMAIFKFVDPQITGLAQFPINYNMPFYDLLQGQWYKFGEFGRSARAMETYADVNVYSSSEQYMSLQFGMKGLGTTYPIQVYLNTKLIGTYLAINGVYNVYSTSFLPVNVGLNVVTFYSPNGCAFPTTSPTSTIKAKHVIDCISASFNFISTTPAAL